jgi:hypothetical protein
LSQMIKPKVAVSELLPGVSVSLNAQAHGVYDVAVFTEGSAAPTELYAGLRAVGFAPRETADATRLRFSRTGSALMGGWTGPERERFLAEARRTLRRFGFTFVPEIPR